MSMVDYQWQRIKCEEQIKYLIDLRQRFRQYLKENFNTVWYSDAQNYFHKEFEIFNMTLIECTCDLINIKQLLSNDDDDDFIIELKCEKSLYINDKLDESIRRIYFNRRYRALINSREILFDDLIRSINEDIKNRIIKIRAICVLDEELINIQQEYFSKTFEEQASLRLHQIRAMINVFFKQQTILENSYENDPYLISLIHSCDSFLSTFRIFLNSKTLSNISLNSSYE